MKKQKKLKTDAEKIASLQRRLKSYKRLLVSSREHGRENFQKHLEFRKICSELYQTLTQANGSISIGFITMEDAVALKRSSWLTRMKDLWK